MNRCQRALVFLYSLYYWALFLITLVAGFLCLATPLWFVTRTSPSRRVFHDLIIRWARFYINRNRMWSITVHGKEYYHQYAPTDCIPGPYIIVANHASIVDIVAVLATGAHFKFVSKVENLKVPFIGWLIRMGNHITVKRRDPASTAHMMERCREAIARGDSVLFFAEGTRKDELSSFRHGAFTLACELRIPILPLVLCHTKQAVPRGSLLLNERAAMTATFLPLIKPQAGEHYDHLRQRVHQVFLDQLPATSEVRAAA